MFKLLKLHRICVVRIKVDYAAYATWSQKKAMKEKKKKDESSGGGVTEMNPWPEYIQKRLDLWDKYKAQYEEQLASKPDLSIVVTLPDGKTVEAKAWKTTPYDVAKGISQGLADSTIIARVNSVLWDLDRPLEGDCKLELLRWDNTDAQAVFWHSSAHMLGEAMERVYGGCLCYGPPIEEGFYYDMFHPEKGVSSTDFHVIEGLVKKIAKEKQNFERLELTKEQLLEMFDYNPFKVRILKEKVDTPTTTAYRCGSLIDLCRGPHVRHTGKVKAFKVTKNSASYWEGKADAESLQRVYGVSFPDPKQLKQWEVIQEEAAKRDHRKIGKEQELFFFHELSPGSCFFQPRGAHIYNVLVNFIRDEYRRRGFQEVVTPNMYNAKLWQTSGHWAHYAENMFSFEVEKETFALKPMNCPGHCLMFDNRTRSWRELPLRMADFGVLHRNELSGALTGLTRVRRFQQDDAHIFCAPQHIEQEIVSCLEFLQFVYQTFGFTFQLKLSTRPEKYLGDLDSWNQAEKCATIQLDFQLPERFNLSYISETGDKKRPVIIHRAILGSVERMIAILSESYAGKWPFWLSPRQVCVVPVGPAFDDYAVQVNEILNANGYMSEADTDAGDTLNKKVRNAQLAQFNYILVVGEKEKTSRTVNVRTRDNKVHGEMSIDELIQHLKKLQVERTLSDDSDLLKF
ncbi:jg14615 [Pararge aegeria aegeria]|uniref:threonine--tRNA ligase n=1 Tax=Pararge aegeria aegeria TaxID=348720 RepID=A0A8S4SJY2_9NEOP|nr:jg14615 [Pararge aegeria aegeria]